MINWKKFEDEKPDEGKMILYYGTDYAGRYTGTVRYKNLDSIIEKYVHHAIENGDISHWAYINFPGD